MSRKEISIDLPPPRPEKPRSSGNFFWILITVFALIGGAVGGVWLGKKTDSAIEKKESGNDPSSSFIGNEAVSALFVEAQESVANGHWERAGEIYREILEVDPKNVMAQSSLTLVNKHLEEANGTIVITSEPEGATVTIPGREPAVTPAEIKELPAGQMLVRIEKVGFAPVIKKVDVVERKTVLLPKIALQKSVGSLELVSQPKGASFKLLRLRPGGDPELVEVGETPTTLESLDAGEYEVVMSQQGWPDNSQKVRIHHNRGTSVSAVFSRGGVNVMSDPAGAEVWVAESGGDLRRNGITPLTISDLPPGRHQVEVRYRNWTPIRRTVEIKGNVTRDLEFSWERSMVTFNSVPEGAAVYHQNRRIGGSTAVTPFILEVPEGDYLFEARYNGLRNVSKAFYIDGAESNQVDFQFGFGSVSIESDPPGAAVVSNGVPIGRTPLLQPVVPPGQYAYELTKENHKAVTLSGVVEAGGKLSFETSLAIDKKAAVSRNYTNGLGQKLVWFGQLGGWVAETETTQSQYEKLMGTNPSQFKGPERPVEKVSWFDAVRYCEQLTGLERGLGNLPAGFVYRLPSDAEWTVLAGESSISNAITSYTTRRLETSTVGSAAPNNYGIYDTRGNVAEWVLDWYSRSVLDRAQKEGAVFREEWVGTDRKVLRGGSWLRSTKANLEIPYRRGVRPSQKDANDVGFRVVLMPE